ncbi:MAG: acetyl-CoA decarbonylase/synthase complex subunit gamma, partial [Candidatus Hodarchaeales archaeon]
EIIKAGLEVEAENRPLIYAATVDNWKEMADLASSNKVPLVLTSGSGDLQEILSLANTIREAGIDIVIDPGTWINDGWMGTGFRNRIELRRAAITAELKTIGYPFLSVPAVTQLFHKTTKDTAKYFREAVISSIMMEKYADILIISPTPYLWSLMPVLTFRQSLYSDPRIHPEVDPGLRQINNPDETSPVCISTNFALTYYTIKSDFEGQKLGTWLIVVDSGGLGVEAAVAGGQLTTDKIVDTMKETGIENKVSHKKIILPGLAARLSGELEEATGWDVIVGPKDSADIKKVYKRW